MICRLVHDVAKVEYWGPYCRGVKTHDFDHALE